MAAPRSSAASAGRRINVALSCETCGNRNYKTSKISRDGSAALKFKKYCKHCKQHTEHIEAR
jgi:large subunit ribosomal protein L33